MSPQIETWRHTDELVDLWSLFIGSSGGQYPRAHPQDPGIYWDCQIARLGGDVEHAWFIKLPSGRVYEWRATWVDEAGVAWIGLIEDHDEDGRTYRFEDPRLMRRFARAGDRWSWRTRLSEWDRERRAWGPWTGPGSDGTFAFRVVVRSVERSSYGRLRATIDVDTYQDLEVFELVSNKGWSAWEAWTASAYPGDRPMPPEVAGRGLRVGFVKRVEWPERVDRPRPWPVTPYGQWPWPPPTVAATETRITIVEPSTWPQHTHREAPGDEATLRCVYAVTSGPEPAFVDWSSDGGVSWTRNPGWDHDHTFRTRLAGVYRLVVRAVDTNQRVLDQTAQPRAWVVS